MGSNVRSIPAHKPFAQTVASLLLAQAGGDPFALARMLVLVPTRRAVRTLKEAFLVQSAGKATLLPRIEPIGELAEETLGLTFETLEDAATINAYERLLALVPLVMRWGERTRGRHMGTAQAFYLAQALADLLDRFAYAEVNAQALEGLVPENLARHWQDTRAFLDIVLRVWPEQAAALTGQSPTLHAKALDPAARRVRLLKACARRWYEEPPQHPIVAAGSTGSVPAVAQLLRVISRLPQGQVFLPGLDVNMPEEIWQNQITPSHPQFALKQLLETLGMGRSEVDCIEADDARTRVVQHALLPAQATAFWRALQNTMPPQMRQEALQTMSMLEAATLAEEARAIALAMRKELEEPGKTVALVTPDRDLARRVMASLQRYAIEVDDSAGTPLSQTPNGVYLRLILDCLAQEFAPVPVLALLKHAFTCADEESRPGWLALVRKADLNLRGVRPPAGLDGFREVLCAEPFEPITSLLETSFAQLCRCAQQEGCSLRHWLDALLEAGQSLTRSDRLWRGEAGRALADVLGALRDASGADLAVALADLPAVVAHFLNSVSVRSAYGRHPRCFIWGLLEARLQKADLMILGGLNEGVWPSEADIDPFLSDGMRKTLGLPHSAFRQGQAAHDFAQAIAAGKVLLTRARKGAQGATVPSRLWLRLDAYATIPRAQQLLSLARGLDWPNSIAPVSQPLPKPPLEARPKRFNVTDVDLWRRDPYAFYAKRILKLKPLDPLDQEPGAADKGMLIHKVMEEIAGLPAHERTQARLLALGERLFASFASQPLVYALWWARFEHIAAFVAKLELARADFWQTVLVEEQAELKLGDLTLVGKPDRIDISLQGGLAIIDYKTGNVPKKKAIKAGYALQLPLLGLMASQGAFAKIRPGSVVESLEYWLLKGGQRSPGKVDPLSCSHQETQMLIARASQVLAELYQAYARPDTAYQSLPKPKYARSEPRYEHLARRAEWLGA